jgi:hypothetical protein
VATKDEYDKVIQETEAAYLKVRVLGLCAHAMKLMLARWRRIARASCPAAHAAQQQRVAHRRLWRRITPDNTCPRLCCSQILESSQTLLTVLKRENVSLQKKRQAAS